MGAQPLNEQNPDGLNTDGLNTDGLNTEWIKYGMD
jgi:hypothetical protein